MRFARWTAASVGLLMAIVPSAASAQEAGTKVTPGRSPQDVLSAVPAEAWAVLAVPSVTRLEQKLTAFGQQLQVPMMSPIALGKMMLGITQGFDDKGGLAVALLPLKDLSAPARSLVIFMPVTDYDALLAPWAPQPLEEGSAISKMALMNKESYVARFGRFAAVAQSAEVLTKVLGAKKSLRDQLDKGRIERIEKDDLTLWVNMGAVTSSDLYNGLAFLIQMTGNDPELLRQFRTASLSVRFDPAGVTIGGYMDADPESDSGKAMSSVQSTSRSLLTGLPKDPFILAGGQMYNKESNKIGIKMLDKMMGQLTQQAGEDVEQVEKLIETASEALLSLRHLSMSVSPLSASDEGMIAATMVLTTESDSKRLCQTFDKLVGMFKKMMADDARVAERVGMFVYNADAEKVGGVAVDHFKVTLPPEELDADWIRKIHKVIGPQGLLVRLATVDDKHVAVTLGGGKGHLARVIDVIKSKETPLAEDAGIKRVAGHVAKKRYVEFYLSADRLIKTVMAVAEAIGEKIPLTAAIPEINAPLAVTSSPAGKAGVRMELFMPMEMISAVKDIVMAQMMAPQQQQLQPVEDAAAEEKLIPYTIIKRDELGSIKVSFDLRIDLVDERLPTKQELEAVSRHLHSKEKVHERTFVLFYLPGMKVDAGAFARAHHNPDLEVEIQPWFVPEKYKHLLKE
ncbi:MAG: hypothetical protein V3W34_16285 [Phycisphaerae bacterium]